MMMRRKACSGALIHRRSTFLSLRCAANGHQQSAKLHLTVPKRVPYGFSVALVGSTDSVGGWNTDKGLQLAWHDNDSWSGEFDVPAGETIEYKFFTRDANRTVQEWQPGDNLTLDIPDQENAVLLVTDSWQGTERVVSLQSGGFHTELEAADASDSGAPTSAVASGSQLSAAPERNGATSVFEGSRAPPTEEGGTPSELPRLQTGPAQSNSVWRVPKAEWKALEEGERPATAPVDVAAEEELRFQPPVASIAGAEGQGSGGLQGGFDLEYSAGTAFKPLENGAGLHDRSRASEEPDAVASEEPKNLEALKVAELKDLLKARGLAVSGRKAELIQRLRAS